MCGIAGIHIKPKYRGQFHVGNILDNLLLGIEPRGKDATGFMSVSFDNEVQVDKAPVSARDFIFKRKSLKGNPQTVMAHTRLATQGHQSMNENNHPVQYGTMFVTHNGVIFNDQQLFDEGGFDRTAQVDTQAIPAVLWESCENGNFDNAGEALAKIDGMMAIAAIDVKNPGTLLLARGYSSPLVMIETDKFIMWASTVSALQGAWAKAWGTPPKANKFKTVKEGEMFVITNGKVEKRTFDYKVHQYSYGGYTSRSRWDDDTDWNYGTHSNVVTKPRGYWETGKNGVRRFKEIGTSSTHAKPTEKDIELVATYTQWARVDVSMRLEAMDIVGMNLDLETDLIEWILFHADESVIENSAPLTLVYHEVKEMYQTTYEDLLMEYSTTDTELTEEEKAPLSPKGEAGPRKWECVTCGELTENVYRCDDCYENNVQPTDTTALDSDMLAAMNNDATT